MPVSCDAMLQIDDMNAHTHSLAAPRAYITHNHKPPHARISHRQRFSHSFYIQFHLRTKAFARVDIEEKSCDN